MAAGGAPEGTVVVAAVQTAGRGRLGRTWISTPGDGLYLSIVLRPTLPFEELWQIGFAASLAAAESVSEITGLQTSLKWPNDVLVRGGKVSGILIETMADSDGSHVVIVGIGVNINTPNFPADLAHKATSIVMETGKRTDIQAVEDQLLESIRAKYSLCLDGRFDLILHDWKKMDCTSGRKLTVHLPNGCVHGTAVAVDGDGNLVLQKEDGEILSIATGEVVIQP